MFHFCFVCLLFVQKHVSRSNKWSCFLWFYISSKWHHFMGSLFTWVSLLNMFLRFMLSDSGIFELCRLIPIPPCFFFSFHFID